MYIQELCEDTHADFADVARVEVADDEPNLVHHVALVEALLACAAEHADEDLVRCRSRVSFVKR